MTQIAFWTPVLLLFATIVAAQEQPPNSDLALEESFDRAELGDDWHSTTGEWKIVDGVMRGKEIAEEKHAAATRRRVETKNAVYQFKFRFVDSAKAFHFGFDPAQGELDKKGHLFSVIVTPDLWKIMKHVDKNNREKDPNEILSEQKTPFESGIWYSVRVTTWETFVTARIEGKEDLKASHPTFGVKKPGLVLRCIGDGVEIDEIKVWKQTQK